MTALIGHNGCAEATLEMASKQANPPSHRLRGSSRPLAEATLAGAKIVAECKRNCIEEHEKRALTSEAAAGQ